MARSPGRARGEAGPAESRQDRAMSENLPKPRSIDVEGRAVGIYEFGDPRGRLVLALHGTPACGAGFTFAGVPANDLALRVVAPDRPGVGLSDRVDSYRVRDYADDVARLADAL